MKLRIITSIIAIAILFIFLFVLKKIFFYFFVFFILAIGLAELYRLIFKKLNIFFILSLLSLALILFFSYKNQYQKIFDFLVIIIIFCFIYLILSYSNIKLSTEKIIKFIFSIFYLCIMPIFGLFIYNLPDGKILLFLFLLICWATDSFAYFIGKNFGRKKLYPTLSPKKTIEGSLGGLLGSIIVAIIYNFFFPIGFLKIIIISAVVSIFCIFGDLFESLIKRLYNVKDSGVIFPGHGGILDRIDGILLAIPIYYILINMLKVIS